MRLALLHDALDDSSSPDAMDVLAQAELVEEALKALGHSSFRLPCDLNLAALADRLTQEGPDAAFNLVESLGGKGCLIHLVPSLLDSLNKPYSGVPSAGIYLSSGKLLAKERLLAAGLPTAPWLTEAGGPPVAAVSAWIVKSVWEHASIGLSADSIVPAAESERLGKQMRRLATETGGAVFAEAYIPGREFNLSVLAGATGPEVLPPAEIRFTGFAEGQARIVCYRAKWDESTPEYRNTNRHFDFPAEDAPLLAELRELSLAAWHAFGMRGYARVDFRVDEAGRPWILELNSNPCLSPDAGFIAAAAQARLTPTDVVRRILADIPMPKEPVQ